MGRRAFRVAMARLMTRTGMDKQGAYREVKNHLIEEGEIDLLLGMLVTKGK